MLSPLIVGALLVGQGAAAQGAGPAQLEAFRNDWNARIDADREALGRLVAKLRAEGKEGPAREAEALADDLLPSDGSERFRILEPIVPEVPKGAVGDDAPLAAFRRESAAAWEALAGRAVALKRWSSAWRAWRLVLLHDPDHAEARRVLGFVRHDGGWATPFAIKQLEDGRTDHPQFGWVPRDWVPHLERGELPAPGNGKAGPSAWLPAASADALRGEMANPWKIDTEHFQIRSTLPLAESIRIIRRLEAFHELFGGMMADVLGDVLPLVQRMKGVEAAASQRRTLHEVYYFADKAGFVEYLQDRHNIPAEHSLGVYLTADDLGRKARLGGASFLYKDDGAEIDDQATLLHEVSHQLLFESGKKSFYRPTDPNYWIFEGLGTYFETIEWGEGRVSVGGPVGPRLAVARQRLVGLGQAVPLQTLAGMNRQAFNGARAAHLHYAEAMAFTAMLMQRDRGGSREAFLDFVRDVYLGQVRRNRGGTIADRLGKGWEELDKLLLADLAKRVGPPRK